ncbi:MAG: helix-turn-helix domain-containing protein [bacterium]|nr:helix-turn-helix domain-containing protein [bacterium]
MRISGTVTKDGKYWIVELPLLDAMTQETTRKGAYAMATDLVETLIDQPNFRVSIHPGKHNEFELSCSDPKMLLGLVLKRQREASGLSLAEVAKRLGVRSRNAYARYEQGQSVPTVDKLNELLRVVSGGRGLVLKQSAA